MISDTLDQVLRSTTSSTHLMLRTAPSKVAMTRMKMVSILTPLLVDTKNVSYLFSLPRKAADVQIDR
jgi:hypothetical protein